MAKNEVYYTLEILPKNIILIKFKDNFVITKYHIVSILKIVKDKFFEYPLIFNIANIDGFDYDAIDLCAVYEFKQYPHRIAIVYSPDNISKKYAILIKNFNNECQNIDKFDRMEDALEWLLES
ncbi:MAG: hypothetical protein KAH05_08455 [Clostridiales bacterium]|nr:hypothetical protein [Clostridiales bacterium]